MTNFAIDGYEIIENFISADDIVVIKEACRHAPWNRTKGGIRNAEQKFSSVRDFVHSKVVLDKAQYYLGREPVFVRAILFNKTKDSNWLVAWHQDKTVALNKRCEMKGWRAWTLKDGVHHVQPPLDILDNMVTFRVHLDAATIENGCLRVVPQSHMLGVLKAEDIPQHIDNASYVDCEVSAGTALVMKPLLLHASSKGINPSSRLVLHIEYCADELPDGLSWV